MILVALCQGAQLPALDFPASEDFGMSSCHERERS